MTALPIPAPSTLPADAKNRALRVFLQGLAVDLMVALTTVLTTFLGDAHSWGTIQWSVLGLTLAKTAIQTVVAYVTRRYIDPSKIPFPTPPGDIEPEVDPEPEPVEPVEPVEPEPMLEDETVDHPFTD